MDSRCLFLPNARPRAAATLHTPHSDFNTHFCACPTCRLLGFSIDALASRSKCPTILTSQWCFTYVRLHAFRVIAAPMRSAQGLTLPPNGFSTKGDEISIGIRAFTYGYDLYAPERNVVFHQYQSKKSIPRFFENLQLYSGIASASHQRLNALVGLAHPDAHPYQPSEAELYGNGHIRNVQTFFSTFGIHPEAKHVEPNLCNFVGEPMMRVFGPALRPNGMGLDYSQIHFRFQDHSSKRNFLESER